MVGKKKTTKDVFSALFNLVGNPADIERGRAALDQRRIQIEEERLSMDKSKIAMETALLEANLRLKNVEIVKQLALARKELLNAGYTLEEVDLELPTQGQV